MPQRTPAENNVGAKSEKNSRELYGTSDEPSGTLPGILGRSETIRQKIMGPMISVGGSGVGGRGVLGDRESAFALFDEPTRQLGGGVLLQPLVEQGVDLLAEIGGVAEARKFIGLQGIARSREKKLPGSLGAELRHKDLQRLVLLEHAAHINRLVIHYTSNYCVNALWKRVEKQENAAGCCSGCAGDYEDPDRTAWEADPHEEDRDAEEEGQDG